MRRKKGPSGNSIIELSSKGIPSFRQEIFPTFLVKDVVLGLDSSATQESTEPQIKLKSCTWLMIVLVRRE